MCFGGIVEFWELDYIIWMLWFYVLLLVVIGDNFDEYEVVLSLGVYVMIVNMLFLVFFNIFFVEYNNWLVKVFDN